MMSTDETAQPRPPTPTLDKLMGGVVVESAREAKDGQADNEAKTESKDVEPKENTGHEEQLQEDGRETPELADLLQEATASGRRDSHGNPVPLPPLPSDEAPILHEQEQSPEQAASGITPYVSLQHLVANLYATVLASTQEADALSPSQDSDVILAHLGDGITFPYELPDGEDTPAHDLCRLLLLPSDFPSLDAEPIVFFLGHRDWLRRGALVDLHLPFCGLLAQARCTFKNVLQTRTTPQWVTAEWSIFEDRRGATQYYARAWRTLSNNPPIFSQDSEHGEDRQPVSKTAPYNRFIFTSTEPIVAGDQCRVCECVSPMSLRELGPVVFNSLLIVNVHVDNVVLKISFGDTAVSNVELRKHAEPIVQTAAQRMRAWATDTSITRALKAVPPNIQLHRQQLFEAWQTKVLQWLEEDGQRRAEAAASRDTCAQCQQTLSNGALCSGCREVTYCNRECQMQHWQLMHKDTCSRCFEPWKKGAERYCKARVEPGTLQQFR